MATAHAQLAKIFVASTGNDASDGSRGAPKRNFQAAHNAVAAGGQIVVLDTAGYGRLSINKSVAITVPPGVNAFVTALPGNNGINIDAGTNTVSLRGLIVEGGHDSAGILAFNVGSLSIEDCTVRNFDRGIYVINFTALKFYLANTVVRGCATAGLDFETGTDVAISGVATDCHFDQQSGIAVLAKSSGASSSVDLTLGDCVMSGNGTGVKSDGSTAIVRLDNCSVTSNGTGTTTANGGGLFSRVNNTIEHNSAGDTAPVAYSAK